MIGKAAAGAVAGFVLAACLLALCLWLLPDHGQVVLIPALITFFPLWTGIMASTFRFASARQAWLVLGLLDLACGAGLQLLHRSAAA